MTTRINIANVTANAAKAMAAAAIALALVGCGESDEPASDQDVGYEEPAADVDVYRPESEQSELNEEDVDVGVIEPDVGAEESPEPPSSEPQVSQRQDDAAADTTEFAALDTDGDDAIAEDEWIPEAVANTTFTEADVDGDGTVNRQEFGNALGARSM